MSLLRRNYLITHASRLSKTTRGGKPAKPKPNP